MQILLTTENTAYTETKIKKNSVLSVVNSPG